MVPQSSLGKVIGALTAVTGLMVVAIGIALVSLNFKQTFLEEKAKLEIYKHQRSRRGQGHRDATDINEKLQIFQSCAQEVLQHIRTLSQRQDARAQLGTMVGILENHANGLIKDVQVFKSDVLDLPE